MALDKLIDDGATLTGGDPHVDQTDRLGAHINWDIDDAYNTPGGPPNGGDFVRLRDGGGGYLTEIRGVPENLRLHPAGFGDRPCSPQAVFEWRSTSAAQAIRTESRCPGRCVRAPR